MDRDKLLRTIAESGYNVGFGAKKTFATFDLVEKAPGWIGFISLAIGMFGLIYEQLAAKVPSAILLTAGVGALYISPYRSRDYEEAGVKLTALFHRLRDLYRCVQAGGDVAAALLELRSIEAEASAVSISKQIFLSDWYAHYKFFAQAQISWLDDELHFRLWRDKIPLSAKLVILGLATLLVLLAGYCVWQVAWPALARVCK